MKTQMEGGQVRELAHAALQHWEKELHKVQDRYLVKGQAIMRGGFFSPKRRAYTDEYLTQVVRGEVTVNPTLDAADDLDWYQAWIDESLPARAINRCNTLYSLSELPGDPFILDENDMAALKPGMNR